MESSTDQCFGCPAVTHVYAPVLSLDDRSPKPLMGYKPIFPSRSSISPEQQPDVKLVFLLGCNRKPRPGNVAAFECLKNARPGWPHSARRGTLSAGFGVLLCRSGSPV